MTTMKRKLDEDSDREDTTVHSSDNENDESEDEPIHSNETDIDAILKQLSPSIPENKASEFLHTLASSKAILYWNTYGEMTYHQRRIPLTEMTELIDYAMLPYNPDVRNPRGLQTFIKGLLELGINKSLIKNKRMLVEMIARQPQRGANSDDSDLSSLDEDDDHDEHTDNENDDDGDHDSYDDDYDNDDDNADDDNDSENKEEEGENSSESDEDEEEGTCDVCREIKTFRRIPLILCPTCKWEDLTWFPSWGTPVLCDICKTVIPTDSNTVKKLFCQCKDCGSLHQHNWKNDGHKLVE